MLVVLPPEHDTLQFSPDGQGRGGPGESRDPPASPPMRFPPLLPPLLSPLPPPLLLPSSPPPELEFPKPGLPLDEPPQPGDPGSARSSSASDARTAPLESHCKRRERPGAQCFEGRTGSDLETNMRFMRDQNG